MAHPTCIALYHPESGVIIREHDLLADKNYHVILHGLTTGIFTDDVVATAQIHRVSGAKRKAFATYAEAQAYWAAYCHTQHGHPCASLIAQQNINGTQRWAVRGVWDLFYTKIDAVNAANSQNLPSGDAYVQTSTNEALLHNYARGA
ncbi:hypothetical protein C8J57DRAFT_1536342 [Mycena rebaudengoi]|nr:hypothetical protein C8J57DRAFT_1536342 [Mycena rebaudengoi]